MRKLLKSLIPPILLDALKRIKSNKYGWHGDYASWVEARANAIGYDSDEILQKVRASLLKVKNCEAVYERDSVIFDEIHYSWPLLAGLMYASARSKGVLHVLDFGGSLGSSYFQNKKFLDGLNDVSWSVVEQKHFVDAGKADFEDERLKFFYDVKSCVETKNPNILVLSSVLQYIEKPYKLLEEILKNNFEFVIVDRTSFADSEKIKLQIVPPSIYIASYPCWFFEEVKFLKFFENYDYKVVENFDGFDSQIHGYQFKGFVLEKINKC